jgi:hypothetical protein
VHNRVVVSSRLGGRPTDEAHALSVEKTANNNNQAVQSQTNLLQRYHEHLSNIKALVHCQSATSHKNAG